MSLASDQATAEEAAGEFAWIPDQLHRSRSRLASLMARHQIESYSDFLQRSVDEPEWFWQAVDRDLDLQWIHPYSKVLDASQGAEWPHWFVGGSFNFVQNCVDRHALGTRANELALIWVGDDGDECWLTYRELYEDVNRFAAGLLELGVQKGDRVGLFMPMIPETAIALFACGKIGAIAI